MTTGQNLKISFVEIKHLPIYLGAFLLVILEIAFLILFLPGKVTNISSWRTNIASLTQTVRLLDSTNQTLSQMDKNTLEAKLNQVNSALPTEKKVSGLVTGLSSLGSESGVIVQTIEFSPGVISSRSGQPAKTSITNPDTTTLPTGDKLAAGVKAIPLSLSVKGDIQSLISFLNSVHNANQIISLDSLDYRLANSGTNVAVISGRVFYQPQSNPGQIDLTHFQGLTEADEKEISRLPALDLFTLPRQRSPSGSP